MATKQQTAVEWAFEQISNIDWKYLSDSDRNDLFNQALKMEREQRINDYNEGVESEYQYHINSAPRITAEQYYNRSHSLPDTPFMRELTEQEADILDKTFKNYYKKSHSLPDEQPE